MHKNANLPEPKFIQDDHFRTIVYRNDDVIIEKSGVISGAIGGAISGAISLTKRQQEIIDLIEDNNKISYRAIAKKMEINDSAIDRHIKNLKDMGVLIRVGGTRGYWKIVKNKC